MGLEKVEVYINFEELAKQAVLKEMQNHMGKSYGNSSKLIEAAINSAIEKCVPEIQKATTEALKELLKDKDLLKAVVKQAILRSADKLAGGFDATFRKIGNTLGADESLHKLVLESVKKRFLGDNNDVPV